MVLWQRLSKYNGASLIRTSCSGPPCLHVLSDHCQTYLYMCVVSAYQRFRSARFHCKYTHVHQPQLLFFSVIAFIKISPSSCPTNAGTDTNQLNPTCWQDLIDIITDSSSSDNCCLGLQQIQDTLSYLTHHYMEKRLFAQECLYDLLSHDYIKPIGQLLRMLCLALAARFISNVDMGNNTHEQGTGTEISLKLL